MSTIGIGLSQRRARLPQMRDEIPPFQELEVVRMIATGLKDVVIARQLGIAVVTVRRRAREFRVRVGAANRAEAIAIAASRGWLQGSGTGISKNLDNIPQLPSPAGPPEDA